jgi:hypothetical protein
MHDDERCHGYSQVCIVRSEEARGECRGRETGGFVWADVFVWGASRGVELLVWRACCI